MRLGVGVRFLQDSAGKKKQIDGIGQYTNQLLLQFQEKNLETIPVHFKRSVSLHHEKHCYSNPYLHKVMPFNLWKQLEHKVDLFHATDYLIPKLKKTPVVATLHDAIYFQYPQYCGNPITRKIKNYLMKAHAKNVSRVIALTQAMVPDLIEYWEIPKEKISVVHLGVADNWHIEQTDEKKKAVLEYYQIEKPFFLMVGTIQPRKNIQKVIRAIEQLPKNLQNDVSLVIAGKEGWQCEEIIKDIYKAEQKGIVKWLRYVSNSDLQSLYQASKGFLFPSLLEGFGLPLLEAFASKTPVIASSIPALTEVAGDAAYLLDPHSEESITHAMETLLTDEARRLDFIQKGLSRVQQFTWERCAKETLAVYNLVQD